MTEKTSSKKNLKIISEVGEELLKLLGTSAKCTVTFDKDNNVYLLDVDAGDEAGLLIGKRGDTINAIQIVVNQIVRQKLGEWLSVVVNIADFREKETTRLENLAEQVSQRVRETKEPQNLYNLTPAQRRVVHMYLADKTDIKTESTGEGEERCLVVSLK